MQYLQAHPLCERCEADGKVRAAVDIHHRQPIAASMSVAEMERLCYDWNNLQALCVPCHVATHKEMGKGTMANRKEREAQRMSRWSESVRRIGQTPGVAFLFNPPQTPKSHPPLSN